MKIRSILLCAGFLGGTYNTTHSMTSVLALAGDASVAASIISIAWGKTKLEDKLQLVAKGQLLEFLKPSQLLQIHNDINAIHPYVYLLLPLGTLGSATARFSMIMQSPIGGFFRATTSLPLNLVLIAGAYALRIYLAPDNASIIAKAADWVQKKTKN